MHHQGNNKELVEDVIYRYAERIGGTGIINDTTQIEEVSDLIHLDQCLHIQKIFLEIMSNILRQSEAKNIRNFWYKEN